MKTNPTRSLNRVMRISLLVALAACMTRVACGTVVMIDFESITPGDQNSTFLQGYGISSVTTGGGGLPTRVYADQPEAVLPSGTHFFTPSGGGYPNPAFSSAPDYFYTDLTFVTPVEYFSFYRATQNVPSYGTAGWQAVAYDAFNNVVDTEGVGLAGGLDYPPPANPVPYLLQGAADITKVRFRVNYNYQSTSGTVWIDDMQFNTTPEPSRCLLLGLGLTGVMLRRRRR